MTTFTKIFSIEMAHAISGYDGPCSHIHGHSYVLHVTVGKKDPDGEPFPPPGFVIDFKALKSIVQEKVVCKLDHALVLSRDYQDRHPGIGAQENLFTWDMEPSAANMLFYVRHQLDGQLPAGTWLQRLLLFETAGSYAEWTKQ